VDHVISNAILYPEYELGNMIAQEKARMEKNRLSVYPLLRDHAAKGIKQELDEGMRDQDDWSIHARLSCSCDLCKVALAFLKSKADSTKIWPLVAEGRNHIMNMLNRLGLPVTFSVEKRGSPHKLIMVKSDNLHETSKERYHKLSKTYEKLISI